MTKSEGNSMTNETINTLITRRSIRKYKSEQITKEELDTVLKAGTYAPTAKNLQSPYIVAVQDPETIDWLNKESAKYTELNNPTPYYGAPTIILVLAAEDFHLRIEDGSAVITNMLNAAHSMGLGSCWINRIQNIFSSPQGKEMLAKWGLPENLSGIASMSLGYADMENPEAKPRKEDYIHYV